MRAQYKMRRTRAVSRAAGYKQVRAIGDDVESINKIGKVKNTKFQNFPFLTPFGSPETHLWPHLAVLERISAPIWQSWNAFLTLFGSPGAHFSSNFYQNCMKKSSTTPQNRRPDESEGDTMRVRKLKSRLTTSQTHGTRVTRARRDFRDFAPRGDDTPRPRTAVDPRKQKRKSQWEYRKVLKSSRFLTLPSGSQLRAQGWCGKCPQGQN